MKYFIYMVIICCFTLNLYGQDGSFSGGFESNTQWYQTDEGLGVQAPQDQLRSNNYFKLNYSYGKFTVGAQYEMYQPSPLLGYFPGYDDNGIATYFANFRHKNLDITAGNFYDQFGSGLIYRSWEDHTLGVDNSIRGIRVNYQFTDYLEATGFIGNQRTGFELSEGTVQGLNTEFDLGGLLELETSINMGASYVGRFQESTSPDPDFPATVNAYSLRSDVFFSRLNVGIEYVYKEPDAYVLNGTVLNGNYSDGQALLINTGYALPGLGINATFRASENMGFFSDREAAGNAFLQQTINFIPGYTKQSSYAVSNIYVYAPQAILSPIENKAGEIGGQIDVVYTAQPGTWIGGKKGTTFSFNYSNWSGLDAEFDLTDNTYEASLFSRGERYFEEFSLEVYKKFNDHFSTKLTGTQTYYNGVIIEGSSFELNGTAIIADFLYDLDQGRSIRLDVQHLSADADRGNWAASTLEYAFNTSLSLYVADLYNYDETDIHYYSVGGSYTKGRTRVAVNYGRQRGGLICVGGVCRFVPENTGFTLNLSTNF
ncbi:DUF6029 family protein [Nonlabens xiamenensis]|uniref:DUF6029 family protein n=1 Tax=Nonlabens xiamenensis TaxID=2341043 RepID=UPI000F60608F|nr:DUF6029 family protein [Nonlabens xiamenensis]